MKKANTTRNIFFIILTIILTLGLFLLSSFPSFAPQAVDNNSLAGTIKVVANARKGATLGENANDGNPIYLWRNLESFTISFDHTALPSGQEPPKAATNDYTITYSIEYYAGYPGSDPNNDDVVAFENVFSATSDDYTTLPSYTFKIDDFLTTEVTTLENGTPVEETVTTKGWGAYQFTININGAQSTSATYYVEPDHLETGTVIEISSSIASATSSGHNAYNFTINEIDTTYKYVNKDCFVWYVYGTDYSDNKYVLTQTDTTKEEFIEYGKWLYDSNAVDRTGETFYFDDNNHSGNWTVYVVYEDSYNNVALKSNELDVITGEVIEPQTVIWIIVGIAAAVLVIVIVVIIITVKKEKVW